MSKLPISQMSDHAAKQIHMIRGKRVMIDTDLARLYGTSTKALNQAVKRNRQRFPWDFMFMLSQKEKNELVTKCDRLNSLKHSYQFPLAFTEQGVAMLSSVLNSKRAIHVNIQIMRAFVQIRMTEGIRHELLAQIEALEKKYDGQFQVVFRAVKILLQDKLKRGQKRFDV